MEGGRRTPRIRTCRGGKSTAVAAPIDADTAARMVAVLCASILAAAGEKDHVKVLATSDIYLDFIRPRTLHVSREGDVSFGNDDHERNEE